MPYQESDYAGDEIYCLNATGDVCVGDEVRFERATFAGPRRRPRFAGFELVTAKVVKESYGEAKQQHTFTLLREDGRKTLIKGRNLYANGVYRKAWADEAARLGVLDEKHRRGDRAREARGRRLDEQWA